MRNHIAFGAVLAASLAGGCNKDPEPTAAVYRQATELLKKQMENLLNGVHIRDITVIESGVRTDQEDQKEYSYLKVRVVIHPDNFGGELPSESEICIQLSLPGTWTVRDTEGHEKTPDGRRNDPYSSVPIEPCDGLLLMMPKSLQKPYTLDVYITTPDAKDAENAKSQINADTFKVLVER